MMKLEKKHYLIGAAVLGTIIALVVINKKNKNKKQAELAKKGGDSSFINETPISKSVNKDEVVSSEKVKSSPFPITFGAEGDAVKAIQKYMNTTCPADLKSASLYPLDIDGVWGDYTEAASLACSILKRNKIDEKTFKRIIRDLASANIEL